MTTALSMTSFLEKLQGKSSVGPIMGRPNTYGISSPWAASAHGGTCQSEIRPFNVPRYRLRRGMTIDRNSKELHVKENSKLNTKQVKKGYVFIAALNVLWIIVFHCVTSRPKKCESSDKNKILLRKRSTDDPPWAAEKVGELHSFLATSHYALINGIRPSLTPSLYICVSVIRNPTPLLRRPLKPSQLSVWMSDTQCNSPPDPICWLLTIWKLTSKAFQILFGVLFVLNVLNGESK